MSLNRDGTVHVKNLGYGLFTFNYYTVKILTSNLFQVQYNEPKITDLGGYLQLHSAHSLKTIISALWFKVKMRVNVYKKV